MRQALHGLPSHSLFSRQGWAHAIREPRQLTCFGRFATVACAAIAVWLDPTRPAHDLQAIALILSAYLLISFGAILLAVGERLGSMALYLLHGLDLTVLGLLACFSEELDSPFFCFFTFTIMTSALLWKMRGVLLTALALQLMLLVIGWPDLEDGESELNFLIIRSCYTWVAAAMLGSFATYRETMRTKMAKLARWQPAALPEGGASTLGASLFCAIEVLESQAALIVWRAPAARAAKAMLCDRRGCRAIDRVPLDVAGLPAPDGAPAIVARTGPESAAVEMLLRHFFPEGEDAAIGDWRFAAVERFHSRNHDGAVIILDPDATEEIGSLMGLVTARVNEQLDQIAGAQEQADAATLKERAAFARDLHDSVLQDMTAAALHLKVASISTPRDLRGSIETASTILRRQQRAIRRFVETSRQSDLGSSQSLRHSLLTVGLVLERQWGVRIELEVSPPTLLVPEELMTEICLMLSEVVSNAVRHGKAHAIAVEIRETPVGLMLSFKDDGNAGDSAGPELVKSPRSLDDRVRQLGGTISCFRSAEGFTISSILPIGALTDAYYHAC